MTPAHQTHTDGGECSADPFCFVCACVFWAYTWAWAYSWAWAFFRAESSDLSHMGVYTGMGVISVWALLWANTVVYILASGLLAPMDDSRLTMPERETGQHSFRLLTKVAAFIVYSFRSQAINSAIHSVWCFLVKYTTPLNAADTQPPKILVRTLSCTLD